MKKLNHWTQKSVADFVYSVSSNFVSQLELRMEEKKVSQGDLATILKKTSGRVSQVFNNPGNLSLRLLVEYAGALGMKASVIAYDDGDSFNKRGPINPQVFISSWEALNSPRDIFEVDKAINFRHTTVKLLGGVYGVQGINIGKSPSEEAAHLQPSLAPYPQKALLAPAWSPQQERTS